MPYSPRVKALAQQIDPECWISYSGKAVSTKRDLDARRCAALNIAVACFEGYDRVWFATKAYGVAAGQAEGRKILAEIISRPSITPVPEKTSMPPLKLRMMLHFGTVLGPFTPDDTRRSEAYVTFVRELLRDGMIERPTPGHIHPGWAYKATPRGQCYIKALCELPLPVRANPEWKMPAA